MRSKLDCNCDNGVIHISEEPVDYEHCLKCDAMYVCLERDCNAEATTEAGYCLRHANLRFEATQKGCQHNYEHEEGYCLGCDNLLDDCNCEDCCQHDDVVENDVCGACGKILD